MEIKEVQKRIKDLENEFAIKLKELTNDTGCVVQDLFISHLTTHFVGDKRDSIVAYDVNIRTYL